MKTICFDEIRCVAVLVGPSLAQGLGKVLGPLVIDLLPVGGRFVTRWSRKEEIKKRQVTDLALLGKMIT